MRGHRLGALPHHMADIRQIFGDQLRIEHPDQRAKLERTGHTCPVHKSLLPEIEQEIRFVYPD